MLSKLRLRTILPVAVVGFVAVIGLLMLPAAAQAAHTGPDVAPATLAVQREQVMRNTFDSDVAVLAGSAAGVCWQCDHRSRLVLRAWSKRAGKSDRGGAHAELRRDHAGDEPRRRLRRASRNARLTDLVLDSPRLVHRTGSHPLRAELLELPRHRGHRVVDSARPPGSRCGDDRLLAVYRPDASRQPERVRRREAVTLHLDRDPPDRRIRELSSDSDRGSPAIPTVDLSGTNLENGNALFVLNCAACHTITGSGDTIAGNNYAPSLHNTTATQAVEAMRSGPGNMPRFGPGTLTDQQVADIVAYVTGPIEKPANHGGLGLGGIGPVAEGFIALLMASEV